MKPHIRNFFIALLITIAMAALAEAQPPSPKNTDASRPNTDALTSSPAFAELLLKKTELQSELESLVLEYTEEFPKVKELAYVVTLLERDIVRLGRVKATESSKLTLALGKLMLRRVELETDLWSLRRNYKDEHPDVKKAKRKVEIYESAISEILK